MNAILFPTYSESISYSFVELLLAFIQPFTQEKNKKSFFSCFSKRDRKSHRRLKKDTDFCSIVLYAFSYRNTFSFHPRAKHLTHQPAAALPPPPPSPSPSPSPPSVPWRSGKHVYVWQHSWQRWPTRNQQGECCCWKSV